MQHFDSESCNEHGMDQTSGSQTMGRVQNNLFFWHPSLRAGVGGLDGVSRHLQPWQIEKELDETFSDRRLLVEAEAGVSA